MLNMVQKRPRGGELTAVPGGIGDAAYATQARSGANALVLICDADEGTSTLLSSYFKQNCFSTECARDGATALAMHAALQPALVVLDVCMPVQDGWSVLATLRERGSTPVILLTSRDSDVETLSGLRSGADDCIVKPVNPAEAVARCQAILRRSSAHYPERESSTMIVPPFEVDLRLQEITVVEVGRRHHVELSATEFKLLAHMICRAGKIHSRSELLLCLHDACSSTRKVDIYISRLRRKLEEVGVHGLIRTVHRVGYGLVLDGQALA